MIQSVTIFFINIWFLTCADADAAVGSPAKRKWAGWWHKAFIFSNEANIPAGRVIYIDLDTIVVGDWSYLVLYPTTRCYNNEDTIIPDTVFTKPTWNWEELFLISSANSMATTEGTYCFLFFFLH